MDLMHYWPKLYESLSFDPSVRVIETSHKELKALFHLLNVFRLELLDQVRHLLDTHLPYSPNIIVTKTYKVSVNFADEVII